MCQILALFIIVLCVVCIQDVQGACSRIPKGANGHRSAVDDNFKIHIDGNPESYIPNHQYNISLSCPINMKFVGFTLVVENEDQSTAFNGRDMAGHFELVNDVETKFSVGCENMIENTNTNSKIHIEVSWIAPSQPDSGCVLIKAAILQHRDVWFIDDGFLTKRICAEEIDDLNSQTPTLQTCCACDEAKYEIVLERKWTRNTHAKFFPEEPSRTRIGEIIGASHTHSYRYWAYGERASPGMKDMAEYGATQTLEREIRENTQNGEVRTMIKAPGIEYRKNIYGTTLANARVDPKHHQISLAAKVEPSPDWILGVAGLELCLSNCTWLERKVLNLYPWDIGTDSGPSYMSEDARQEPPDVIRHMSSSYPSDYRSPFFDDTGAPMKPLATLYVTRKKLYIRECEEVPQDGPLECATHPWNDWSNCSTRCGSGFSIRFRSFKNPTLAANYNCDRTLEETRPCEGTECGIDEEPNSEDTDSNNYNVNFRNPNGPESMAKCELSNWSEWSPCSKICGRGNQSRTRQFFNRQAAANCHEAVRLPLEEFQQCVGNECGGAIRDNGEQDDLRDTNTFGDNNPTNSWDSVSSQSGFGMDRSNQDWNSNNNMLSSSFPAENQRGQYDGNRQKSDKIRNYNFGQNNKFNPRGFNDNRRQPDGSRNPNYALNNNLNPLGFNGNQLQTDNFNDNPTGIGASNYDYTNNPSLSGSGFSTRAPYLHYPDQQSEVGDNFQVVQDYCYSRPVASIQPCLANPVVIGNFWFYDHFGDQDDAGGKCKIFTTDNCDQNRNRFRTLEACEGTCIKPMLNQVRAQNVDGTENIQPIVGGFGQPMSQIRRQ